ncbi:porin [Alphaproteobacteria bacterium]|nr:porin [Alphaproteobacteria bacterium]
MRKVLLATTALVAMSVTAAQAEVSIGGQAVFEIYSPSTGSQTFSTDGGINVKGSSTTDSGLTFTALSQLKFEGGAVNDSYIDIKGDFGSIRLGDTDAALDRMDGAVGASMDLEGTGSGSVTGTRVNLANSATQIGNGDPMAISFFAPSMNGLSFYGQAEADGAGSGFGVNYSIAGVSLMAQSIQDQTFSASEGTTDEAVDATSIGVSFSMAGVKFGMGSATWDSTPTQEKITATDIGVSYSTGDMKLVATSASGKQGTRTDKYSNVGVSYTIAPGVTAMVESGRGEVAANDYDATWMGLAVDF